VAIKPGIKASGTLDPTQQTLYQTTPNQSASVKVTLFNTSINTVRISLLLKDGTEIARNIRKDMELGPKSEHSTCYYELGPSDSIEGQGSTAVHYSITGITV